jgi:hypothetical protein
MSVARGEAQCRVLLWMRLFPTLHDVERLE